MIEDDELKNDEEEEKKKEERAREVRELENEARAEKAKLSNFEITARTQKKGINELVGTKNVKITISKYFGFLCLVRKL